MKRPPPDWMVALFRSLVLNALALGALDLLLALQWLAAHGEGR